MYPCFFCHHIVFLICVVILPFSLLHSHTFFFSLSIYIFIYLSISISISIYIYCRHCWYCPLSLSLSLSLVSIGLIWFNSIWFYLILTLYFSLSLVPSFLSLFLLWCIFIWIHSLLIVPLYYFKSFIDLCYNLWVINLLCDRSMLSLSSKEECYYGPNVALWLWLWYSQLPFRIFWE